MHVRCQNITKNKKSEKNLTANGYSLCTSFQYGEYHAARPLPLKYKTKHLQLRK